MKYATKGIWLGLSLCAANKFCLLFANDIGCVFICFALFFIIPAVFLVSKDVNKLLTCGFTGLFVMLFSDAIITGLFFKHYIPEVLGVYFLGFWASMAALSFSLIVTIFRVPVMNLSKKGVYNMSNDYLNKNKLKLLLYLVFSVVGFVLFMMPENASVSVPVFVILQMVFLYFLVPDKKRLWLFVPVLVFSVNAFVSANRIWQLPNLIISLVLFCSAFAPFDFKANSLQYFSEIFARIASAFSFFGLPFKWAVQYADEKSSSAKKVAIAIGISVPVAIILIVVLSNADEVFSIKTQEFMDAVFGHADGNKFRIALLSGVLGLFLFGGVCTWYAQPKAKTIDLADKTIDAIIVNTVLCVILFVYTLFVIVQFKYLFAGSELPHGLTYTEYARKGFFELLGLTAVNIAVILTVVNLTKHSGKNSARLSAILCHYLCAVTVVLLVSSFYRMWLYTCDDGLTRLRLLVMIFLGFELLGLVATFFYIAKPKFNITLVYVCIALVYYMALNVIPMDNIIARNQVDLYLKNERVDYYYILTLSEDAAPAWEYFYNATDKPYVKSDIITHLGYKTNSEIPERWQRYNLSTNRAKEILERIK